MSNNHYNPKPIFDTLHEVIELYKQVQNAENFAIPIRQWLRNCFRESSTQIPSFAIKDFQMALRFIYSYRGSKDTFGAYRRELERLLQWSWFVREQSIMKHKREDIEAFIEFCMQPYKRWIGLKKVARFKCEDGQKTLNPEWRPFQARVTKKAGKNGIKATKADYQLSQAGLKALFAILSSFYNYLLQEEIIAANPVKLIRQKSKFIRKEVAQPVVRRLSEKQWKMVLTIAKDAAKKEVKQERAVFILSCLYGMYLRISELVANDRWTPTMGDFFKDANGHWWFKTVGKGNKARQIAVSDSMLQALMHYRMIYLNESPYPSFGDKTPLVSHIKNINNPIKSSYPIRQLVQFYFDKAAIALEEQGDQQEAESLRSATVHWLRHTGISDDVKRRPREHVRDDAGHSSSAITDRYIDVELRERAQSAKKKLIIVGEGNDDVL